MVVALAAWLLAQGPTAPAAVLSPLVKLRPGEAVAGDLEAKLGAARGECEAFQLYVPPPAADVELHATPLKGPGPGLSLALSRVEYVEVATPSNGQGRVGLWPDPLVPWSQRARSTPERPLVAWVEACVPAGQPAGRYLGALELRTAGRRAPAHVPVSLEVWPFSLPATSSLPTAFGLSLYTLAAGHGLRPQSPEARELLSRYAATLLAHRLSPYAMGVDAPPARFEGGQAKVDFRAYDEEMAPFLQGTALASGARFTSVDLRLSPAARTDEEQAAYLRAFRAHLAELGWSGQTFLYAKDEPRPKDFPRVLAQARWAKGAGVPLLVTGAVQEPLAPHTDIFCPAINCFFPRPGPATCPRVLPPARLRALAGPARRVWWYQSCLSHGCEHGPFAEPDLERAYSGWASYMVDHPATANRAMGTLAWAQGIEGELYFDTLHAYRQAPWRSVFAFGGNGDGTLFYPLPDAPAPSLRLKHIRDGLEDYEYLRLLAQGGDLALAQATARQLARSGYELETSPKAWEAARLRLAQRLSEYGRRGGVGRSSPGLR